MDAMQIRHIRPKCQLSQHNVKPRQLSINMRNMGLGGGWSSLSGRVLESKWERTLFMAL